MIKGKQPSQPTLIKKRYLLITACPTDTQYDWYIVDTLKRACVQRVSGLSFGQISDAVNKMNWEAHR